MANISHFTQTVNGVSTTYDIHDANAVDLNSNQTVGGIKTFSNAPVVNSISLDGKIIGTDANGNMTYDGHIVDTIEEQGDGYIRYSNGIQICYGGVSNSNGLGTGLTRFSFPKAFGTKPNVIVTPDNSAAYFATALVEGTTSWVLTAIAAYNGIGQTTNPLAVNYIAIGTWK